MRARPSSARPAKRVKQPQEPIPDQTQTVVNPNGLRPNCQVQTDIILKLYLVIRDDDEEEDDLVVEVEAPIGGSRVRVKNC